MRAPTAVALAVILHAVAAGADDPAPSIPASLEEAAAQHGPIAPGRVEPALPAPPPTSTATATATTEKPPPTGPLGAAAAGEVERVGEWEIVGVTSRRRRPGGGETGDACGYERDVMVRRTSPVLRMGEAVLVVACAKNVDGLPVPTTPTLRLSRALSLPPPVATSKGVMSLLGGRLALETERLDLDAVAAVLTPLAPALEECHDKGGGPGGELEVRLGVVTGEATAVTSTSGALKGGLVERCILDVLRAAPLPSPTTPAGIAPTPVQGTLKATFTFEKSGKGESDARPVVRPVCKAGEAPEIKDGQPTCTVQPKPNPCAPGEVKKTAAQLGPGEQPCFDLPVERGVPFLKGELTSMGDVQLVNARNSFGVGFGAAVLDGVVYAVVRPDVNLRFGEFGIGLGAPLRFEVLNLNVIDLFGDPVGDATANSGRFRLEDWDQLEDLVRPIRYLTWGKKEDKLYIDLNRVRASTIGHGQLVRRYNPNLDIDEDNLFAQVDGYGDYGGVELMAGPFPVPRLVGGLAFIKPLGIVNAVSPIGEDGSWLRELASSWSIGLSYVTDLNTPTGLERRLNPDDQRPQLIVDSANQLLWRNKPNPVGDVVQGVGVDTEVKVLKSGPFDLKVYGDYSHLFFSGDSSTANAFSPFNGGGFTLGGLLRLSLGETPVRDLDDEDAETQKGRKPREMKAAHGVRFRLEGRTFAPTYLPSYWNTMYEADRFQFGFDPDRVSLPTKIGYLAAQQAEPWRVGYFSEVSYAWVDIVGVTAAFEDAYAIGGGNAVRGKNLALHVESKGLGVLQVFGTYHFRNFEADELGRIFSFTSDNEILFVGGRVQVLPILFVNVGAQRAFRVGFDALDDPVKDARGQRFSSFGLQNIWAYGADVELGWQF